MTDTKEFVPESTNQMIEVLKIGYDRDIPLCNTEEDLRDINIRFMKTLIMLYERQRKEIAFLRLEYEEFGDFTDEKETETEHGNEWLFAELRRISEKANDGEENNITIAPFVDAYHEDPISAYDAYLESMGDDELTELQQSENELTEGWFEVRD
jgi:hypothetical protein